VRGRTDLCRLITRSEKISVEDSPKSIILSPQQQVPAAFDDSPYPLDLKDLKDTAVDFDLGLLSSRGMIHGMDLPQSSLSLSIFSATPPDILDEIINTFALPQTSF
jgi:hypothetical protein